MNATDIPLWVKSYLKQPITGPVDFAPNFWDLVQRPYAADDCWLWRGTIHKRDGPRYSNLSPRRHIYEQLLHPIPVDEVTALTCANHLCVSPNHIALIPRTRTVFKNRAEYYTYIRNRPQV